MRDLGKNALEWSVFGVSCVLVLALLGFLGYASWTYKDSPARFDISFDQPVRIGQNWHVAVELTNNGGHAAESVEVEVEWPKTKQSGHFALMHLPRLGKRTGYVIFEAKGTQELPVSQLEARVAGYEEG